MRIEDYKFGRITIEGETYTSDVLVWPEDVDDTWWREEGHNLSPQDLSTILEKSPDVLVIGTGANGVMQVPQRTVEYVLERCDNCIVERTRQACAKVNELQGGAKRVAAALPLTC